MIRNERQYRFTKTQVRRFEQTLVELKSRHPEDIDVHPLLAKAQVDAVSGQVADLREQLREYESLKSGKFDFNELMTVTSLPEMLIKARIARGMTQRDLAERVGLKEQQVQRYEATDYASASLGRIRDVVGGLMIENDLLASRESKGDMLFSFLRSTFPQLSSSVRDYRFEVRPNASIYVRKSERGRGIEVARIRQSCVRHFPNSKELQSYMDRSGIELDPPRRDYLISPEHIGSIVTILKRKGQSAKIGASQVVQS